MGVKSIYSYEGIPLKRREDVATLIHKLHPDITFVWFEKNYYRIVYKGVVGVIRGTLTLSTIKYQYEMQASGRNYDPKAYTDQFLKAVANAKDYLDKRLLRVDNVSQRLSMTNVC